MSQRRHLAPAVDGSWTDPLSCEEYGYGLGKPDGILVLKYHSAGGMRFGETRQDFLHQLYWAPEGVLAVWHGADLRFTGPGEAFWVHRAVTHEAQTASPGPIYRILLRQAPPALTGLRAGAVRVGEEAARLIHEITRPRYGEADALAARERIMAGLTPLAALGRHPGGGGYALIVARALAHDPAATDGLAEWAARLHVSVKTLQRDFEREFGMSFSRWRTRARLRAARALLETLPVAEVARRVGYASPSAFIVAFTKEFGRTPGSHAPRRAARAPR